MSVSKKPFSTPTKTGTDRNGPERTWPNDDFSEARLSQTLNGQTFRLPPPFDGKVAEAQDKWRGRDNTRRLWSKDAGLWTGGDEADWLGWLDIIDS